MEHHHTPHNESSPAQGQSVPEGANAFVERFRNLIEGQKTVRDELRDAYHSGNLEQFEELTSRFAEEALSHDDEFNANIQELRALNDSRLPRTEQKNALSARQRELFEGTKRTLIELAGLPSEAGSDEYEASKQHIEELIKEHIVKTGEKGHLLEDLGILTVNEEGKEIFTYPRGLFPASTDDKWDLYLEKVRAHVVLVEAEKNGQADRTERVNADEIRKLAHDAVTKDIHNLLQLDSLPEREWGFDGTRRMVAKMRDKEFPKVDTAEKMRTTDRILKASHVLGVLGTKLSDLEK